MGDQLTKELYVGYAEDGAIEDIELRNDELFPWLEGLGLTSHGKDDDEWTVPEEMTDLIEHKIQEINERTGSRLRADWT